MLRTFVYYEDKNIWMEETHLLFHDLCAFLDEEFVNSLNIVILEDEHVPRYIQDRIDSMLEAITREEEEEHYTFTHIWTIRLYFIFSLGTIFLTVISIMNLTTGHSIWELSGTNRIVSDVDYNNWIAASIILFSIILLLSIFNLLLGIWEREIQVIIFSLIGVFIFGGLLGYLSQGIYLFIFQPGSTTTTFIIAIGDLAAFSGIILLATLIFLLPNIYKFLTFFKHYREYIF